MPVLITFIINLDRKRNSIIKERNFLMEENLLPPEGSDDEKLYSKKEFEKMKQELEESFLKKEEELKERIEKECKKANMSELEIALDELNEIKEKYKQKENECLMASQKEDTIEKLKSKNLDSSVLQLVYTPLDMTSTEEKIEILNKYTEKIKEEIYKSCINAPLPLISKENAKADAFIEGFETNKL